MGKLVDTGQNHQETRPSSFDEFIGNRQAVQRIQIAVEAAQREDRTPPHMLLTGSPGVGKTSLGLIVATALKAHAKYTTGGTINDESQFEALLHELKRHQKYGNIVLIIDEIHRLADALIPQESWYSLLEDFDTQLTFPDDKQLQRCLRNPAVWEKYREIHGVEFQLPRMTFKPFTVIGMTTDPGLLSPPLRDRFGLRVRLHEYTVPELVQIVLLHADKRSIEIDPEVAKAIAQRARGNPRWAIHLLCECRDRAVVDGESLSASVVDRQCDLIGIQLGGVMEDDLKVLRALEKVGDRGLSLASIAATTGLSISACSEIVEPFLKHQGYLIITNRRKISDLGRKRLEQG